MGFAFRESDAVEDRSSPHPPFDFWFPGADSSSVRVYYLNWLSLLFGKPWRRRDDSSLLALSLRKIAPANASSFSPVGADGFGSPL